MTEDAAGALPPGAEPAPVQTHAPPPPAREFQPASPQSIHEAIAEVTRVVGTLRETLEEMEQVLETLELFERQKDADEREIQSLRRALRPLHGRREG